MATTTPKALVAGAPRQPLPFGLFSVLSFRPEDSARWQGGGVSWEHLPCDASLNTIGPTQNPQSTTSGLPKTNTIGWGTDGLGDALVFSVYGYFQASPIAWSPQEAQDRANEALRVLEEAQAEAEFWSGTAGSLPSMKDTIDLGSVGLADIDQAIPLLEKHIAETYGSLGVIHMSRFTASALMNTNGGIEVKGSKLQTKLGTPVVAGTGYPDGEIRATPALFGYRSEPFNSSNRPGDLLKTSSNDMMAIAERTYLIGFDPCGVGSVTVTAPTP